MPSLLNSESCNAVLSGRQGKAEVNVNSMWRQVKEGPKGSVELKVVMGDRVVRE